MDAVLHNNIDIKPSILLTVFTIFVHVGVLFCLFFLPLSELIKTVLIVCVGISFFLLLWKFALLKSPQAIRRIALINTNENSWQLLTNKKNVLQGQLRHSSYIADYLMLLNFGLPARRGKIRVILFKDAVSGEDWRQLRIILINYLNV